MGAKLARPDISGCRSSHRLWELQRASLKTMEQARAIWREDKEAVEHLTIQDFDDIFGHIIGDPSEHYSDFVDSDNVHKMEEDILDGCVSAEALAIVTLLCKDRARDKLHFIFSLYSLDRFGVSDPMVTVSSMRKFCADICSGLQTYFRPEERTGDRHLDAFFEASLESLKLVPYVDSENSDNKKGEDGEKSKTLAVRFSDFWAWAQDTSDIYLFLDQILWNCLYRDTIGPSIKTEGGAVSAHSKVTVGEEMEKMRPKDPLWDFQLRDMIDYSWINEIPAVDADEITVMSALELMVLSGRSSLPVMGRKGGRSQSYSAGANNSSGSSSRKPQSMLKAKPRSEILEFLGVIDLYIIMQLLGEVCPTHILMPIEPPSKMKKSISRRMSERSSSSMILDFLAMNLGGGNKETNTDDDDGENEDNPEILSDWQVAGAAFGEMTLRTVMERRVNPDGFISALSEAKVLPSSKSTIKYKPTDFLFPDSFIFAAALQLARGYRNVLISFDEDKPENVSHIISDMDFLRFYRKMPDKLLGTYRDKAVSTSGLMTIPLVIPVTVNLGTALVAMSQRGLNSAALTDEDGCYCGRITQRNLLDIWWNWRTETSSEQQIGELEEHQERFRSLANPASHRVYSQTTRDFSFFGILNQPLKFCARIGVKMGSLVAVKSNSMKKSKASSMQVIDEDSDENSDSDSSTSSSSGSLSSSSISSPKGGKNEKEAKAPGPESPDALSMKSNNTNASTARGSISGGQESHQVTQKRGSMAQRPSMARPSMRRPSAAQRRKSNLAAKALVDDRLKEEEEDWKAEELSEQQEENRRISDWYHTMGVMQPSDTIAHALDAMVVTNSSKTFVVDEDGSVAGSIDFMNILRKCVRSEADAAKNFYFQSLG